MIILQPIAEAQTFSFIPRVTEDGEYEISIIDEYTNKEIYNVTYQSNNTWGVSYYYQYTDVFDLKKDNHYTLKIKKGGSVVFRDKIFCTDQTPLPQYDINKHVYTTKSTSNEYITIDD